MSRIGWIMILGAAAVWAVCAAKKTDSVYRNAPDQRNPLEGKKVTFVPDPNDPENADGVRGHLEVIGQTDHRPGVYERWFKRAADLLLSAAAMLLLSPVLLGICAAIYIDDPGPVLFTQKRLGRNKQYFKLHKFRSMKVSTPHDRPTHMLENPEQYITRVGRFLRAHSLDELPQIWDILLGNMSVVGPRPGLWNQDLLTAERDRWGANDVRPGLTGWAQINGRDALEIPEKARLDGEYCRKISLGMDIRVFLGSLHVFRRDDSLVEGGVGELKKGGRTVGRGYTDGCTAEELIGDIGFGEPVELEAGAKRRILITGASSYIGENFRAYAADHYPNLEIRSLSLRDPAWRETDFAGWDIVYHLAGIAHADVGKVSEREKAAYYEVNTDLAVEVCRKAKAAGVGEFIFMSSMIVYGDSAPLGKQKLVDRNTVPAAANFYGDSKLQADAAVRAMADETFRVIVLRPPMIYGRGSKGNYPAMARLAVKLPLIPDVKNARSMLHIDVLCEFLCRLMLVKDVKRKALVLIPQNGEWTVTSRMMQQIARAHGKSPLVTGFLTPAVMLAGRLPGKVGGLVNKAFGSSCYAPELSVYPGLEYQTLTLEESIRRTEGGR